MVYGAKTKWTSPRSSTGGLDCDNATFGDPLWRVVKACYAKPVPAPVAAATWTQIASEGQRLSVSGTKVVRFGVAWAGAWAGAWVSKNLTGTGICDAAFFGIDPKLGNAKTCEIRSETVPAPQRLPPISSGSGSPRGQRCAARAIPRGWGCAAPTSNMR